MKESHRKGLANYPDPESCMARRKATIEALTGAQAGRVLSCEIPFSSRVPTASVAPEGPIMRCAIASGVWTLRSLRPRHVWTLHAREPGDPRIAHRT